MQYEGGPYPSHYCTYLGHLYHLLTLGIHLYQVHLCPLCSLGDLVNLAHLRWENTDFWKLISTHTSHYSIQLVGLGFSIGWVFCYVF